MSEHMNDHRPQTMRMRHRAHPTLVLLACATLLAGCEREQLLGVETPDQIRPEDAASPNGALAIRAGAMRDFTQFFGGTTNVGVNIYVGLLSDELINARPGADHIDQRAFNENTFPAAAWNKFSDSYTQTVRAIRALNEFVPAGATRNRDVGQLYALQGMTLNIGGELFCNGVPLSTVNDAAPEAATLVTTTQMYQRAIAQADSALGTLGTTAAEQNFRYLARVAKARAQLNLGQFDAAAATVSAGGDGAGSVAVPTAWQYAVEYSQTTLVNSIFDWMVNTANFGPSDREGGNGLDFRSARDPRVNTSTTSRLGQDGSTQVFTLLGYPNGSAPTTLVSGVTARLIEAEAALRRGDVALWLAKLNEPRVDPGVRALRSISLAPEVLPPLADPGNADARVSLHFRERAFWFYLTATRVGDLRRLQRQYNRPANAVWPTGAYFKGGTYGSDVTLTPSFAERNNTAYTGCADRNP
jgi:starch-binding outer membrane protein, SusD/RagB family